MMNRIVTLLAMVALLGISTDRALATNVTAASNMSAIQGGVTGDGIINFNVNGTLTMDQVGTGVATISVAAGVAGVIQFDGTTNTIQYAAGAGAITIGAGGSLTIAGTNASAGLDFSTNNNAATLTVNGSIAGAVNANLLIVGNNTLTVSAAATFAGTVRMGGASATLDNDAATTITSLTMTGALNITPADTMVLTLTNPVAIGANTLTITGSGAGGAEAVNGSLTLNNASSQVTTAGVDADDVLGDVTVTVSADGATLDVNFDTSPVAVNMTAAAGDLTLQVATGKTMTTTVDVNDNTLTLAEAGTVSTIQLDTATGIVDVDASATATTLSVSAASTIDLDTDAINFTVTNAFNIGANKLSLVGSGAGGQETFTATVQLDGGAGSELEVTGADVDNVTGFTVTGTADGGTLDTDINTAPAAVNMTAGAGNLTLEVATGKTITTTIDVNDNTLTISEAGAVTTIQMDMAAGIVDVNETMTVTTLAPSNSVSADVASGKTLTVTNGLSFSANTQTLLGKGSISRVDATTGTITDNGGTTITDLRITPGAGTFTWNGTGVSTIADFLANSTFATGNIISKAGTGSLTLTGGVASFFSTAGTQIINVTAGTLAYGTAGANNDVTFSQDADEITVANGATLTTYGSFTVGAAAANVNLDAVAGSTVNLSATSAKSFTGLADDDFNLLGTVNINGSATYTIADAFNYKFGSINISDLCSLDNNQPSGEIKFVPDSIVTLNDTGGFRTNGQADGTLITMDTTTGAGSFTMNRTASPNLSLLYTNLSRCTYTSATVKKIASCDSVSLLGTTFLTGTQNWEGTCGGGGGSLDEQNDNSTTVEVVIDIEGGASLMTTTSSGASAEVTISDALEGQSVSITLVHSNTKGTFAGTSGDNNGLGNGVPRTLTIDTGLAKGEFKAVVKLCVTETDLSGNNLTRERIGLFVFNETTGEWEVQGTNNRGNAQPTSNVGDHGIFQDGFESGNTCAWAVVDGFSTFIAGEMSTFTLDASASSVDSGSVAIDPVQTVYSEGMVVNLTATPTDGFGFTEWLIDDQEVATANPLTITMDQNTVVVGQFDQIDMSEFVLGLTQNDADGGTITASPQAASYVSGTEVTLTATPADGFTFGGWSGDIDPADTSTNPLTITVDSNLEITGFFFPDVAELLTLSVSLEAGGQEGLVSISPTLEAYQVGTIVTLTATPAEGFVFAGWSGDATGTDNPLQVTIESNLSIGAAFEPVSLGGDNQGFGACGAGAGCGALGTLSMCLILMGLAGLKRRVRRK